jgi:RND family efflux transporter MFP subunit
MKKQFFYIPMALLLLTACSSSEGQQSGANADATTASEANLPTVKVAKVSARDVDQVAEFTANVEANVRNEIAPQSPVRITDIRAEVGDHVRKGQTLVVMDNSNLKQLKAQLDNQKTEFDRVDELYKVGGASKSEWDAKKMALDVTQASYNNLVENTTLQSPIDGVISARNYDKGDLYSAGNPVLVVEQISPVKILINVNEQYYKNIKKGMPIETIALDALPGENFTGSVSLVYPTLDATTRTFPVEVKIKNENQRVRPGMFARVTVNFGTENRVVVPDEAIVKQVGAGDRYVYVVNADGTVSYNKVELGRRMGTEYEVISGVDNNATVVIAGQNKLANGVKVQIID